LTVSTSRISVKDAGAFFQKGISVSFSLFQTSAAFPGGCQDADWESAWSYLYGSSTLRAR
jgi:hypothetical protein